MRLDVNCGAKMAVDVGDDRMEPPPVEIIRAQLIARVGWMATNYKAKCPAREGERALGDLRALVGLRPPAGAQIVAGSDANASIAARTLVVFSAVIVETMLFRSAASITSAA
jgi:hypothetical protein